jgi:flagellar motor protein MotB
VKRVLVANSMSPSRITTGDLEKRNQPLASNATSEERAENRRVEIILE